MSYLFSSLTTEQMFRQKYNPKSLTCWLRKTKIITDICLAKLLAICVRIFTLKTQTSGPFSLSQGVKFTLYSPCFVAGMVPQTTRQLLYLITQLIWQPRDRLVFLGQSQIDNLFQLSFCPAWHHSIRPSVISLRLPRALFHLLLPSTASHSSVSYNNKKATLSSGVVAWHSAALATWNKAAASDHNAS